jgi:hypothetical protein
MSILSTKVTVYSGVKYTSTRVIRKFTVRRLLLTEQSLLTALEHNGYPFGHLTYRARRTLRISLGFIAWTAIPDEDVSFKRRADGHLMIDPDVALRRKYQRLSRR